MVASRKNSVYVFVGERLQVGEAGASVCVAQPKLAVFIASADIDVPSLGHHDGMMEPSSHQLHLFATEVLDVARLQDVFRVSVT